MAATGTNRMGCLVLIVVAVFILIGIGMETKGIGDVIILGILAIGIAHERSKQEKDKEKAAADAKVQAERAVVQRQVAVQRQVLGDLMALSPLAFEQTVGRILAAQGYVSVEHVGGSGDRGADLTAIDPVGRRVVVQCKRYAETNKVGSPELQRFVGAVTIHGAHHGLVVTTSSFSAEARAIAVAHRVELVDGPVLRAWAQAYNASPGG